jgi:SAM-dependent methyltransferase
MSEPTFDVEGFFDEDYLYFYGEQLEAGADSDTELIWQLLELAPGMEVLDLACGHGRIANRLAQRGCRVTGLDSSPLFLQLARQHAEARDVTVDYVHGDMRNLPWTGRFDRIINWSGAFGYFDDVANQHVLASAAAALKPGGWLAIDLDNYPAVVRRFAPSTVMQRDGNFVITQWRLDLLTSTLVGERTTIRDGRTRHTSYSPRIFTYTELRDWLRATGFTTISGYGDTNMPDDSNDKNRLTVDSRRMIVVAKH